MPLGFKKYTRQIIKTIAPAFVALFALSCATMVSPTGGPKDITPPKLLSSEPRNLSTNFNGKKLILVFDEYIQLKTPEKYLLISPPLSELPDIRTKGRSVVIKIKDSLRINTTYNFYFGDAIVDIAENNPVTNFNFAFSTGSQIDSLSLSGNVTDALSRMPVKGALVLLYNDFSDSIPLKQIPMYVSRTSENGDFRFNSLASGKYRAVALVDANSDYIYNLPTELIGFSSDSVAPYYSVLNANDTSASIKTEIKQLPFVSIDIFPEPDSTQRIQKSVIASKNKLNVAFRYPMISPAFRALNVADSFPWATLEWNRTGDTLNAWLLNKPDTLKLEVADRGIVFDTLVISTTMKTTAKGKNAEKSNRLKYTTSVNSGVLGYGKPLMLTFTNPVEHFDLQQLNLRIRTPKDTLFVTPAAIFTDSIHRNLQVTYNWNSTDKYNLYIPKGSFTDIYSDTCDSTHVAFQIRPVDEYGKLAITVSHPDQNFPVIIQLLTEKGVVIDQRILTTGKRADFGLLPPAKYGLKAIMDANSNGRWDTGVFLKKIQPEKVMVHPKIFDVKPNWDLEEEWNL